MNLGEMIVGVRFAISDPEGGIHKNEVIISFINRAYQKIWRKMLALGIEWNTFDFELTFTSQEMYIDNIGETQRNIQRIILVTGPRGKIPLLPKRLALQSSVPTVYWFKTADVGRQAAYKMGYYISGASPTVTVSYVSKVAQFNFSSDILESIFDIPEEYHDVVVDYASVLALGTDEDIKLHQAINLRYQDSLEDMIQSLGLSGSVDREVVITGNIV